MIETTVDPHETAKFGALADQWWAPEGKMRPLHRLNPVRLGFIREEMCRAFGRDAGRRRPLDRLRVLDIGCGGGLLAEPLTRMGALVTGLDAAPEGIEAARAHADAMGLAIDYRCLSVEALAATAPVPFDAILAMEVIEHVADVGVFLSAAARLVRPGGRLIAATLNRTAKARLLAIGAAEYVLGWLPRGTHDFDKFLTPATLAAELRQAGLEPGPAVGIAYHPIGDRFALSRDVSVNYMLAAEKPEQIPIL